MADFSAEISSIPGTAPPDLVAYYESESPPSFPGSRINCLPFTAAKEHTRSMLEIPLVNALSLWILDDANDSNPFAYLCKGPCTGMIIHFSHDPEPAIAFSSLKNFINTLQNAGQRGIDIDDIVKEQIRVPLDEIIAKLAEAGTDDATALLTIYLPISETLPEQTKQRLAMHVDFFVREAFASHLATYCSEADAALAERLAADRIPQVARAGKFAVAAIRRARASAH